VAARITEQPDAHLIPRTSTELLYKHLPKPIATLIVIPNAGYNTISDTTEYGPLLRRTP
jgi:hypothetical protein